MAPLIFSRITLIWVLLVSATALSWELGHGLGFSEARSASVAIIIIAFVKVRFVILDFMEIRHAPLFMRAIGELWVASICSVLVVLILREAM